MTRFLRLLLLAVMVSLGIGDSRADTSDSAYAKFFLDDAPAVDSFKLPAVAREPTVARVRIIGSIFSRGGRDQSGLPPRTPKYIFGAQIEILDVISGAAVRGARITVSFAKPSAIQIKYPHTPLMRARDYFIVIVRDDDNGHQLIGFPIGKEEYESWESEKWAYERERGKPGHRDK